MKVRRSTKRVVHTVAQCATCEWQNDENRRAARRAADHVRETGHYVHVEQTVAYSVWVENA